MNHYLKYILFFLLCPIVGCAQDHEEDKQAAVESEASLFGTGEPLGELNSSELTEVSGMAASRSYENAIWVHNDSGNEAALFLINENADVLKKFVLEGIENRDWEDMAMGPGPDPDLTYLYLGDIGDNLLLREQKVIYRFAEPTVALGEADQADTIRQFERFEFQYPDQKQNAEALFLDPISQDIYIIAKSNDSPTIYRFPKSIQQEATTATLEAEGRIEIESKGMFDLVTAADISTDGMEILVKTYGKVYHWQRNDTDVSVSELLRSSPDTLSYVPEPQGEAITFTADQQGFFTLSEKNFGRIPVLFFYPRK